MLGLHLTMMRKMSKVTYFQTFLFPCVSSIETLKRNPEDNTIGKNYKCRLI